jgi:hypothetical protein
MTRPQKLYGQKDGKDMSYIYIFLHMPIYNCSLHISTLYDAKRKAKKKPQAFEPGQIHTRSQPV